MGYLSLSRRGRLLEAGEEPVGALCRARHARLVIVASDASDHTLRRAGSFVAGTKQLLTKIPFTKEELGGAIGLGSCAVAAFADERMALAFVRALEEVDEALLRELENRAERAGKRQREEKARRRNLQRGKRKQ